VLVENAGEAKEAAMHMRRTIVLLATMSLTLLVASRVVLGVGIGSAGAQSSVAGPGESIQKAVNAADPGDTIVVRGVHREDVVIRKNGIKLRGEDAVIQAPTKAKADSPCSRTFGPEAICVLGDVNIETGKLTGQRVSDVSVSGFTIWDFEIAGPQDLNAFLIDVLGARNTTVVGNRATGNVAGGIITGFSINTTIAKNDLIGSPETDAAGIEVDPDSRNTKIVNNVVRSYVFGVDVEESTDITIVGNDLIGNSVTGIGVEDSAGTKILSNVARRNEVVGIFLAGTQRANAKVVGNNISGGAFGIYVTDVHRGSFAGNEVHDNCAGMFFEAFPSQPVAEFEVKANTVENNTRSCRAPQFDRPFSGIGIELLGASGMEVTGNQISGNVPSGPTRISGGVVVAVDPYVDGAPKPTNNSVTGNHFGPNKPDIFWDDSGSGNSFVGNLCNTSVPSSLCN
jgi:parallel beta-helix repeat protein